MHACSKKPTRICVKWALLINCIQSDEQCNLKTISTTLVTAKLGLHQRGHLSNQHMMMLISIGMRPNRIAMSHKPLGWAEKISTFILKNFLNQNLFAHLCQTDVGPLSLGTPLVFLANQFSLLKCQTGKRSGHSLLKDTCTLQCCWVVVIA